MTWVRYGCNLYSYNKNIKPTIQFGSSLICVKNGAEKIVKRKVWPCHLHCASLCQTPEKPANLALPKIIFFPKQEHKTVKSQSVLTTVCDCFIVVGNIYIDYLEIWIEYFVCSEWLNNCKIQYLRWTSWTQVCVFCCRWIRRGKKDLLYNTKTEMALNKSN